MHQVFYAGTSLITGDEIAFALMEFAARLGARPEIVEIPCRSDQVSSVERVLVSPSAPMIARRVDDALPEIEDDDVVDRLRGRQLGSDAGSGGELVTESPSTYDFNEWF